MEQVRAPRAQFVLDVSIDLSAIDPRDFIRRETTDALAGTMVRVDIGDAPCMPFIAPFVSPQEFDWLRADLVWQFHSTNQKRLNEWQLLVAEIQGWLN